MRIMPFGKQQRCMMLVARLKLTLCDVEPDRAADPGILPEKPIIKG
jgi:hypothetical protein